MVVGPPETEVWEMLCDLECLFVKWDTYWKVQKRFADYFDCLFNPSYCHDVNWKTIYKSAKFETLNCFCLIFRTVMWFFFKVYFILIFFFFIVTHSIESRC